MRRPLFTKRSKKTAENSFSLLSAEDKAALVAKLAALKAKHAQRVMELARVALEAMNELEQIEETMDSEARELYPRYETDIQDFKLTFQQDYAERAREYNDDAGPFLDEAKTVIADMCTEAEAAAARKP
jgi:hypothetical protein